MGGAVIIIRAEGVQACGGYRRCGLDIIRAKGATLFLMLEGDDGGLSGTDGAL